MLKRFQEGCNGVYYRLREGCTEVAGFGWLVVLGLMTF